MKVPQEAQHALDMVEQWRSQKQTDATRYQIKNWQERALMIVRKQALEEAAVVAENYGYKQVDLGEPEYEGQPGIWGVTTFDNRRGNEADIAAAIRQIGG